MFDPIEIHGEGEFAENYTRICWNAEENAINVQYINEVTGVVEGDELFSADEADSVGYALIDAAGAVADAVWAAKMAAKAAEREKVRADVAARVADQEKRKEAFRAKAFDWEPKSANPTGRVPRGF